MVDVVVAKGMASIGAIGVGEKNVKVVLIMSKRDFFRNAKFFEGAPEEIEYILGDMQVSLEDILDDEREAEMEDARRAEYLKNLPTKLVTVDSQGVVQKLEPTTDGQAELHIQAETMLDADIHEAEQNPQDDAEDDQELLDEIDADHSGKSTEPTKEDIEAFILANKPRFDDINFDPEIIEEKINKGLTWIEIAKSRETSSSVLQTELGKYRKRVAEMIKKGAA